MGQYRGVDEWAGLLAYLRVCGDAVLWCGVVVSVLPGCSVAMSRCDVALDAYFYLRCLV